MDDDHGDHESRQSICTLRETGRASHSIHLITLRASAVRINSQANRRGFSRWLAAVMVASALNWAVRHWDVRVFDWFEDPAWQISNFLHSDEQYSLQNLVDVSTQTVRVALLTLPVVWALGFVPALRARTNETRCRRCGYVLRNLVALNCPECGERI